MHIDNFQILYSVAIKTKKKSNKPHRIPKRLLTIALYFCLYCCFLPVVICNIFPIINKLVFTIPVSNMERTNPNILITGGAGYIGSHTILCLLEAGYDVTIVDNLVNSSPESINRIRKILSLEDSNRISFHEVDLLNKDDLEGIFQTKKFQACIHFAGLKAVGESVMKPLLYYENNLCSTINLLSVMDKYGCRSIVFSSSATVYGMANVPITEDTPVGVGITNPYGRTKYMIEEILQDFKKSKDLENKSAITADKWSVVILRYFNPVGAHPSGEIGEDPNGIPNNLMPFVAQVVVGRRPKLMIFGNDYDTPDGTGVRDYIHVMDLAEGHVAAIKYIETPNLSVLKKDSSARSVYDSYSVGAGLGSCSVFNLGTGNGYSVLDMVRAIEKAANRPIPYEITERREGDIAVCYADTSKAKSLLNWCASRNLDNMCSDLWNWQSKNPQGYSSTNNS